MPIIQRINVRYNHFDEIVAVNGYSIFFFIINLKVNTIIILYFVTTFFFYENIFISHYQIS